MVLRGYVPFCVHPRAVRRGRLPASLRETLSGPAGLVVAVVFVLLVVYSFLAGVGGGGIALVVWLAVAVFSLWLVYRFVRAHERIAAAEERRADASERRARAAESRAGLDPTAAGRADEPGSVTDAGDAGATTDGVDRTDAGADRDDAGGDPEDDTER